MVLTHRLNDSKRLATDPPLQPTPQHSKTTQQTNRPNKPTQQITGSQPTAHHRQAHDSTQTDSNHKPTHDRHTTNRRTNRLTTDTTNRLTKPTQPTDSPPTHNKPTQQTDSTTNVAIQSLNSSFTFVRWYTRNFKNPYIYLSIYP